MMSSFDTVTVSLLNRIPTLRSSNHSIIASPLTSMSNAGYPEFNFSSKSLPSHDTGSIRSTMTRIWQS